MIFLTYVALFIGYYNIGIQNATLLLIHLLLTIIYSYFLYKKIINDGEIEDKVYTYLTIYMLGNFWMIGWIVHILLNKVKNT